MRGTLAMALAALALLGVTPASAQDASFTTLGTNAGPIPNISRAEPANLLRYSGQNILIDVGDGAAWQLSKAGVSLRDVKTIVISHLHFDHTGGLFAFLSQRYQMIEASPLAIYGPPGTKALVQELVAAITVSSRGGNNMRAFSPGSPGGNITVTELADGSTFTVGDVRVRAVRNTHYVATPGGDAPDALSLSLRFDMPGKSIVYTGDTGPSDAVESLAKGADLLVSEVMDPDITLAQLFAHAPGAPEEIKAAIGAHFRREHLSPAEAGTLAARAGVKQLILTHNGLPDDAIENARAVIARQYRGQISFARDLDKF